jgi:hypothetical protein
MKGASLHVTAIKLCFLLQCTTCDFIGMLFFMGALSGMRKGFCLRLDGK